MRIAIACLVATLAACGGDDGYGDVVIQTRDIIVKPGEELTYCYYLHTDNDEPVVVNKWVSDLTPGSHHMVIFENPSGFQPEDHKFETPCPIVGRSQPIWVFSSQTSGHDEWTLPDDDGTGKPLGQLVRPHMAIYVQIHMLNHGDTDLPVHVTVRGEAMPKGLDYTPTANFVNYNNSLKIPPGATNHMETATCKLPEGTQYVSMATHSHKQTVTTYVKDGDVNGPVVFTDSNWEHPETVFWKDAPFYKFQSNEMTWQCLYDNTGDNATRTIYSGQSSVTDEMCVAFGFYFPAPNPLICIYDTTIPELCSCSAASATGGT